jgi:hypothetical protein
VVDRRHPTTASDPAPHAATPKGTRKPGVCDAVAGRTPFGTQRGAGWGAVLLLPPSLALLAYVSPSSVTASSR